LKKEVPFILMLVFTALRFCLEAFQSLESYKVGPDKLIDIVGYALSFMGYAAVFLGCINLAVVHGRNIRTKRKDWVYSVLLLVVLFSFLVFGLVKSNSNPVYMWIWNCTFVPIDSTMFSLIAFFIASAAYRAFRIRNVEASLMMFTAAIVMLAQVPVGEVIWGSEGWLGGIPGISSWILAVPNAAASRALSLSVFLGFMATQARVLLGIERRFLGQD
jgi:hypothetical protein